MQTITAFRLEQFNSSQWETPKKSVLIQVARLKTAVERYGQVKSFEFCVVLLTA